MIRGSGSVFSAGYDIGNLEEAEFEESAERLVAHPFHDAIEALEAYAYPVLGEINGHAIGGGLELALTCDIRLAARGARFAMPPAKLGPDLLAHRAAQVPRRLRARPTPPSCSTSARRSTPSAPAPWGSSTRWSSRTSSDERVVELAGRIAANAPLSLAGNKRVIRTLRTRPLPEAVERELIELRESCFRSEDFREGVRAFAEKRKPRWQGR